MQATRDRKMENRKWKRVGYRNSTKNPFLIPISKFLILSVLALMLWGGCKSSEPPPEPDPEPLPQINLAAFEDFDVAAYRDAPPVRAEVEHDVPESLMDGRAAASSGGVTRTVQGYRIQLYSSQDKALADRRMDEAAAWWNAQRRQGTLEDVYPGDLSRVPVYLVFRQPYYRVRFGDFATRAEAQRILRLLADQFPDAFIAPDTVTITR